MEQFATSLKGLTWAEMVSIGEYIADTAQHAIDHGEPLDRDSVSQWLSEMADDILRECEAERAATQTPLKST